MNASPKSHVLNDGITSLVAGLGTARDKAMSVYYEEPLVDPQQFLAMYRTSWLARKIVDIPALDSYRRWRTWQASDDQVEAIENEEKRLDLKAKMLRTETLARLYGGAALYFDLGDDASKPAPKKLAKGQIRFCTVLSHWHLVPGEIEVDPMQPGFGQPKWYEVAGHSEGIKEIHPSRLVLRYGTERPDLGLFGYSAQNTWGDSVLYAMKPAIEQFDSTAANLASLVYESKVDVISVQGLMHMAGDPMQEAKLLARYALAATAKGNNGMLLLDKDSEEYTQKNATFTTLPDILDRFGQNAAGGADIPMTRLFGQSPGGLNSTGDADLRNYYDAIASDQTLRIGPSMEVIDDLLIWSALGSRPVEIHYVWSSLWQIDDTERAALGKAHVETVVAMQGTGLFADEVLTDTLVSLMVDSSVIPGLEASIVKHGPPVDVDEPEEPSDKVPPTKKKKTSVIEEKKTTIVEDEQLRAPKGTPTGGQWVKSGAPGSSLAYMEELLDKSHQQYLEGKATLAEHQAVQKAYMKVKNAADEAKLAADDFGSQFMTSTELYAAYNAGNMTFAEYEVAMVKLLEVEEATLNEQAEQEAAGVFTEANPEADAIKAKAMAAVASSAYPVEKIESLLDKSNKEMTQGEYKKVLAYKKALESEKEAYVNETLAAAKVAEAKAVAEAKVVAEAAAKVTATQDKALASVATAAYPVEKIKEILAKDPKDWTQGEYKKALAYKKALEVEQGTATIPMPRPAAPIKTSAAIDPTSAAAMAKFGQIGQANGFGMKAETVAKLVSGEYKPDPNKPWQAKVKEQADQYLTGVAPVTPAKAKGTYGWSSSAIKKGLDELPPPTTPSNSSQLNYASYQAVNSQENNALQSYTGSVYRAINKPLRTGVGEHHEYTKFIDSAIGKSETIKDMVVVRGIKSASVEKWLKRVNQTEFVPGVIIKDHGFPSTTRKTEIAASFSQGGYGFKIKVPKGSKMLPLRSISTHASEDEFLLPRGSSFRIDKVTDSIIEMSLVT